MRVIVIAPHADDEVLGVGGTIIKHIANGSEVFVCIVTRAYEPFISEKKMKIVREETITAHKLLGINESFYLDYPAVMMEKVDRYEINNKILDIIQNVKPDIAYIPHFGDMQRDHLIVAEASMVALRPKYKHKVKEIYAYETLSETEWNIPHASNSFLPNVYTEITDYLDKKVEAMKCFESQMSEFPNPRSTEAIISLARYRGSTVSVHAAEAFMMVRAIN